jgi:hypothetical protein
MDLWQTRTAFEMHPPQFCTSMMLFLLGSLAWPFLLDSPALVVLLVVDEIRTLSLIIDGTAIYNLFEVQTTYSPTMRVPGVYMLLFSSSRHTVDREEAVWYYNDSDDVHVFLGLKTPYLLFIRYIHSWNLLNYPEHVDAAAQLKSIATSYISQIKTKNRRAASIPRIQVLALTTWDQNWSNVEKNQNLPLPSSVCRARPVLERANLASIPRNEARNLPVFLRRRFLVLAAFL